MKKVLVYKFVNDIDEDEYNLALFDDWDMSAAYTAQGNDCNVYTDEVELEDSQDDEEAIDYAWENDDEIDWEYYTTYSG